MAGKKLTKPNATVNNQIKKDGTTIKWYNPDDDASNMALCNITYKGITFYGVNLINGKNGPFLSFPSKKANDGKYYSYVFVPEDDIRVMLEYVTAAYESESGEFTTS